LAALSDLVIFLVLSLALLFYPSLIGAAVGGRMVCVEQKFVYENG
jgi:hypothetical protein